MTNDNIKEIINDARRLAALCEGVPADLLKFGIEGLANRLKRLTCATPEAAREFASAQKDIMDGKSLNAVHTNPPLTGFAKSLSVPELGIQFCRHKSANITKLVATWRDDFNDHIYEITVQRDGDSPNCGWRALATNDGNNVFQLRTRGRTDCEHCALSAMKCYLKRGHRKTFRTLAKKEGK